MSYALVSKLCLLVVLALACLPPLPRACFIRNCPMGGKRSMDSVDQESRPCPACGPNMSGQCVGPNICCGDFGCLLGTVDSQACRQEDANSTPCFVRGATCGGRDEGVCVADGICCDSEACSVNSKCQQPATAVRSSSKADLMQLIHRLLRARQYD